MNYQTISLMSYDWGPVVEEVVGEDEVQQRAHKQRSMLQWVIKLDQRCGTVRAQWDHHSGMTTMVQQHWSFTVLKDTSGFQWFEYISQSQCYKRFRNVCRDTFFV